MGWDGALAACRAEAVGRLTAGVAHELNNPLTTILGCAHLAAEALGAGHPATAQLRSIQRATDRCSGLLRELLDFARETGASPAPCELSRPLSGALTLIEPLAKYRCLDVHADLGGRPMPVWAEPRQLAMAFIHLTADLIDGSPPGGSVEVRARPASGWAEVCLAIEMGGGAPSCRGALRPPMGAPAALEIVRRYGGSVESSGSAGFRLRLPLTGPS